MQAKTKDITRIKDLDKEVKENAAKEKFSKVIGKMRPKDRVTISLPENKITITKNERNRPEYQINRKKAYKKEVENLIGKHPIEACQEFSSAYDHLNLEEKKRRKQREIERRNQRRDEAKGRYNDALYEEGRADAVFDEDDKERGDEKGDKALEDFNLTID